MLLINFCKKKIPKNLDPLLKSFINRVPNSVDVDVEKIINGPESFTPDSKMIMGESAEVDIIILSFSLNSIYK